MYMEKIGILGYGEVGKSLAKFYQNPKIKDLKIKNSLVGVEILHICIPYSKNFIKIVKQEISEIKPKLTIIHSSVPVGTTQKIGGSVVHSPVRGVHPCLFKGLSTFIKFVGFDRLSIGLLAKNHFKKIGIKSHLVFNSRNTEALKLWSTTQYGLMIILNKEIKKYCSKNNLNFDVIYTLANASYNSGYIKLKRPEVVRPFLEYVSGKIGGHCVLPNCDLLGGRIANLIKKINKEYV